MFWSKSPYCTYFVEKMLYVAIGYINTDKRKLVKNSFFFYFIEFFKIFIANTDSQTNKIAGRGVEIAAGCVLPVPANAEADGVDVVIGVRPEHFEIGVAGVRAQVVVVEPTGADTQVYCRIAGQNVTAVSRARHTFRPGDTIELRPSDGKSYLFNPASGARIA